MTEIEELRERITQMDRSHDEGQLKVWKLLNEQLAELRILSEVVQCLAASHPNLDPVMENLLSKKDEFLAGSPQGLAQMYAESFDRWHIRLLYAQRVMQHPGS